MPDELEGPDGPDTPEIPGGPNGPEVTRGIGESGATNVRGSTAPAEASYVPMFAHLALVLGAGIYLPAPLVVWFQNVARLLG